MSDPHEEIEEYGDQYISSKDAKVATWLKFFYIILPIWGIISLYLNWNGAHGWFDRGYWFELEKAANTTFPVKEQEPK